MSAPCLDAIGPSHSCHLRTSCTAMYSGRPRTGALHRIDGPEARLHAEVDAHVAGWSGPTSSEAMPGRRRPRCWWGRLEAWRWTWALRRAMRRGSGRVGRDGVRAILPGTFLPAEGLRPDRVRREGPSHEPVGRVLGIRSKRGCPDPARGSGVEQEISVAADAAAACGRRRRRPREDPPAWPIHGALVRTMVCAGREPAGCRWRCRS